MLTTYSAQFPLMYQNLIAYIHHVCLADLLLLCWHVTFFVFIFIHHLDRYAIMVQYCGQYFISIFCILSKAFIRYVSLIQSLSARLFQKVVHAETKNFSWRPGRPVASVLFIVQTSSEVFSPERPMTPRHSFCITLLTGTLDIRHWLMCDSVAFNPSHEPRATIKRAEKARTIT